MQLFILPYAGGSIAAFKRLTCLLDDSIEAITVEYPGRGSRIKEEFASSFWSLLDDSITYCRKRRKPEIPYAVMGYSMGSVLAYEMVARKSIEGELNHLFISAEVSPKDRSLELRKVDTPTEDRIMERVRRLGGLDERMLKNKRFADIYIKPMISDFRLFSEYRFRSFPDKIKADTTFFYCENDTAYSDVEKWNEIIDGNFDYHELGENHFFINQHYEEMAEVINSTLCQ